MKRILFLATMFTATFMFSCTGVTSEAPDDPFLDGYNQIEAVVDHTLIAMDPFNLAYRLNLMMNESPLDQNGKFDFKANAAMYSAIMGTSTNIDQTIEGVYKITCNNSMGTTDVMRRGLVFVYTNNMTMSTPGAVWDIVSGDQTTANKTYTIGMGSEAIRMDIESYKISCNGANSWTIDIGDLVINPSTSAGVINEDLFARWNTKIIYSQDSYDQSYANFEKSDFTASVTVTASLPMLYSNRIDATTQSPLKLSPACTRNPIIGGGAITAWFDDDIANISKGAWLVKTAKCEPTLEVTYKGETRQYAL